MLNRKIDYLNPDVPPELPWKKIPLIAATSDSLRGYGELVDDYESHPFEIVTWPASGWRSVDTGTGNEGGTTEGIFEFWWEGDVFFGRNNAVNCKYLLGWCKNPSEASLQSQNPSREQVLLWHANYHPDGGQLFYPMDHKPFVVPLALPGDDIRPDDFVAFYFDGRQGLYIQPNVWHEGIFPLTEKARFFDKQGKVHARISCNIAEEFGVFLQIPLKIP